jgi:molybdate transport system permease protein
MSAFVLSPEEWQALFLSLKVAAASLALSFAPGVLCGWLFARRDFPGKLLLEALVHAPLVLPPVVIGYALLLLLGRNGLLGGPLYDAGIRIAFTWQAAMLASAIMGFPLMVRAVRLAVELVDPRLEQAAATLGATPLRVFLTITMPLAVPGILTGSVLAFARSLGEFGATITFAGNIAGATRTLPLALFSELQVPGGESAAVRLAVISVAISLGALVASELVARRLKRTGRA